VWEADPTKGIVTRYYLYRKLAADPAFPSQPINSNLLEPMKSCSEFLTVIPNGSEEWVMLSRAFSYGGQSKIVFLKNVCDITSFAVGSPEWDRVQLFTYASYKVAIVMGQAYIDSSAAPGQTYTYQLRKVSGSDESTLGALEQTIVGEVTITAGSPNKVPSPENVRCVPGDSKVQILWNKPPPEHALYSVYRSLTPTGTAIKINESDVSMTISVDLDSNAISPEANGFTDYERWDSTGTPKPRTVPGNPTPFTGPSNGTVYYYKVMLRDMFGNTGPFSSPLAKGEPIDKTPPATPDDVIVIANETKSTMDIKWRSVSRDADGRNEVMGNYRVFRYETADDPEKDATPLPGSIAQPTDPTNYIIATDKSGGLRSACGDKLYYYRVQAIDAAGNESKYSVAVGAVLKDTVGPASPTDVKAEENVDNIRVQWKPVKDCDVERYNIYRAYCDYGAWLPCPDTVGMSSDEKGNTIANDKSSAKGDCGGPFEFRGTVSHADAMKMAAGGFASFDDTPPPGSPVCYAYLVKSQDSSQNLSGTWPVTDPDAEGIVCQRLRDKIPPEAAVVSGLFALDSAIKVEYIGPPIQDIAAYHIYRTDKSEAGPYDWVGGMLIAQPPAVGVPLTEPYKGTKFVGCDSIPLVSKPFMSAGVFIDHKAEPKRIYWYKVLGIDLNGNQTSIDSAVGMSTFTFATGRDAAPTVTSITPSEDPCALRIEWTPAYEKTSMQGFAVFRGTAAAGPFIQVGNIVRGNEFMDRSVVREITYWYRVCMLKIDGSLTSLSAPKSALHP
jgi:fibronectin type 3 domain-containing protein